VFTEELVGAEVVRVELHHQWLGVLRETGREHNQLKVLLHALEELRDEGANQNVNCADLTFNFDWQGDVSVVDWLERRMHKSLVQIEHQRLHSLISLTLRAKQKLLLLFNLSNLLNLLLLVPDTIVLWR